MTSDPERLLARSDGEGAFSRELLAQLGRSEPPAGAREAGWNGVARSIALLGVASAGVSVAAGSASAAKGATTLLGVKTASLLKIAVGLGLGAASVGLVVAGAGSGSRAVAPVPSVDSQPKPPAAPAPVVAPAQRSTEPVTSGACRGSECESEKPAGFEALPPRKPTETERADLLSRESALLVKARAALRASNVAEASALLSRLESQFPRGTLVQEREVLRIELLDARGERAAAAKRARAFIVAHPKSPHSAKLARFAGER